MFVLSKYSVNLETYKNYENQGIFLKRYYGNLFLIPLNNQHTLILIVAY